MTNKKWESRYLPSDPAIWQGRADAPADSCFYQHVQTIDLLKESLPHASTLTFAIVGFKCDEGNQRDLGRAGAAEGPIAIRQQLGKLPIQNPNVACLDVGNIICTDHDLEKSQEALGEIVALLLANNIRPIIIGGSHDAAWGHYQGIATNVSKEKRLGIINFDAHFDLQPLQPSHCGSATTTFYQVAESHHLDHRHFDYNCLGIQSAGNTRQIFTLAKALGTHFILADDLHLGQQEKCVDFIDRVIDENDAVYISISLDVFAAAYAPGVSTIQPVGLNPWHVIPLLRQAAASGKVISYDLVEHIPRYDIDHRTAKLAATLVYEIIHHHAGHTHV